MPASWRPSRGPPGSDPDHDLDEIAALAGVDRMTIPPPLLDRLAAATAPLPRRLAPEAAAAACADPEVELDEPTFRAWLNADVAATTKLAEGINAFVAETEALQAAIGARF